MTVRSAGIHVPGRRMAAWSLAGLLVAGAGCGKKGPPLPPLVRLPAAVEQVAASRLGHDVYLTFTVPRTNVDSSTPIDLGYVDVYAFTGTTPPPRTMFVAQATRLVRVPVAPPVVPGEPPPPVAEGAATAGAPVTVRDTATGLEAAGLRRYYLVIPFSTGGRPGAQHAPVEVPYVAVPPAPAPPQLTVTAAGVTVAWMADPLPSAPGGPAAATTPSAPGAAPATPAPSAPAGAPAAPSPSPPVTVPPTPAAAAPADAPPVPAGPASAAGSAAQSGRAGAAGAAAPPPAAAPGPPRMNVYRVTAAPAPAEGLAPRPQPLNTTPLAAPPFAHAAPLGMEICYVLRRVVGDGAAAIEGEASAPACITPLDRFPPAAPTRLVALATAAGITLLWEPNTEPDLAGYLVLRGAPGDAMLQPLTTTPIADARYTDTTAVAGMRYVYAVVAVDTVMPTPNVSAESARVEETGQ